MPIASPTYVCVFAKPPQPGQVKTRLARTLGDARAVTLAQAFLEDTWSGLHELSWAHPVVALADGPMPANLRGGECWSQGDGDLGQRLERTLRRATSDGAAALAIGADTPGLPSTLLEQARDLLATHDAVLGPAEDGGFYLLGLKAVPLGLLDGLPWSSSTTYQCTLERLHALSMTVAILPGWFDVDTEHDLARLRSLLDSGALRAARTLAALRAEASG